MEAGIVTAVPVLFRPDPHCNGRACCRFGPPGPHCGCACTSCGSAPEVVESEGEREARLTREGAAAEWAIGRSLLFDGERERKQRAGRVSILGGDSLARTLVSFLDLALQVAWQQREERLLGYAHNPVLPLIRGPVSARGSITYPCVLTWWSTCRESSAAGGW